MNIPPEVLGHVGIYLDFQPLLACALVCRHWNDVFTPLLWNSVDSSHSPWVWPPSLENQDNITAEEHVQRVSTLIHRHKQHIRDLKIMDGGLLRAAFEASLTGLLSLCLDSPQFLSDVYSDREPAITATLVPEEHDELIPKAAFYYRDYDERFLDLTRAFWLLVFMNPGLRRLELCRIEPLLGMLAFMTEYSVGANGMIISVPTPTSQAFLLNALSRLGSLRHLRVGQKADEFLFRNLGTHFPGLKSFVHSELVHFDPWKVRLDPHMNLRSLKFICSISPEQLRTIVVGFPALDELSIRRLEDRHNMGQHVGMDGNEDTALAALRWDEDLVHASLKRLAIDEMSSVDPKQAPSSGLLRSRTIFPTVTKTSPDIMIKCAMDIGRVLYVLPSVKILKLRGISDPHIGDEDGQEADWKQPQFETFGQDNSYAAVKSLEIDCVKFGPSKAMDAVFAQMHSLSSLNFTRCTLDGSTLTALSKHLKSLENLEFNIHRQLSKEFLGLLVDCPKLKRCVGKGHFTLAEDIVNSPEWTCHGLERLDIMISGVPRLTRIQEALLNRMRDQNRPEAAQTVEEQEALDRRQESYALQRKVYQRLGRLTNLDSLCLGNWFGYERKNDCLELTLASGLDELSGLDKMMFISFILMNHRVGEAEDLWMNERWSMVRPGYSLTWRRKLREGAK
ncbi:hypothetical protein BGW39_011558 [Mortierella sp. 14UC]|nr:hypothetical protein BGW39_011558 [Mortierella sp. 14UC]